MKKQTDKTAQKVGKSIGLGIVIMAGLIVISLLIKLIQYIWGL